MAILSPAARLLAAGSLFLAPPAAARTDQDVGNWLNLTVQGTIADRLIGFAEVQPRITDGLSRTEQVLLRPAIGWQLSDAFSVYQGYARVIEPAAGVRDRHEDRSFQQLTWVMPQDRRAEIQSRTRFEQRWRNDGRDMALRLRQMIRGERALRASGDGVRALGWAEVFVNLRDTDWAGRSGFDRVRGFVGVEVPVAGRSTLEAGYLNQTVGGRGRSTRISHVASVLLFVRP